MSWDEMHELDKWLTHLPKDPDPVCYCERCGCSLYEGDRFYLIGGEKLCRDCMEDVFGTVAREEMM